MVKALVKRCLWLPVKIALTAAAIALIPYLLDLVTGSKGISWFAFGFLVVWLPLVVFSEGKSKN
jgi:hypothetical protein